ncbi:hypothetical protein [Dendrosporobacter sp. 1207_IL3150]|uniref:hypothetical protein n=1 Tax=Dendrosporobacter sp. 1207_IL3150 TaxID=3084054 RepID=UPI002FD98610
MNQQDNSVKIEKAVKKLIPVHFLLNRYAVTLFNLAVMTILGLALWDLVQLLLENSKEVEDLEKIMDGSGSIIVAYGIVLEERESIMQIFGYYPKNKYPNEILTDEICYDAGIILLVLGLIIEVVAQFEQIPNTIIDTKGHEPIVFGIGAIFLFITLMHFLVFCYKLITLKHQPTTNQSN